MTLYYYYSLFSFDALCTVPTQCRHRTLNLLFAYKYCHNKLFSSSFFFSFFLSQPSLWYAHQMYCSSIFICFSFFSCPFFVFFFIFSILTTGIPVHSLYCSSYQARKIHWNWWLTAVTFPPLPKCKSKNKPPAKIKNKSKCMPTATNR